METEVKSAIAEQRNPDTKHVEDLSHPQFTEGHKEIQVASVSFQTALFQEQLDPWCRSSFALYGVIVVTTLSMCCCLV